jgi:NNP family nitrate/nitrite transporter-like MFS transporter
MFGLFATPRPAHYPLFLLFGMLSGCGIATFSVGIPAVSYWYPQKAQGSALAIYAGLGNLAPGLFALLLPSMVVWLGFTVSYVLWFGILTLLVVLVYVYIQDAPYFQYREMGIEIDPQALLLACGEELLPSGKAMDSVRKAGSDWRTWTLTYFYFISFGGFIALTVWFPTYWSELFAIGIVQAGMLTALYSLSASLLRVLGGYAADRMGGEKVTLLAFGVVATGALLVLFSIRSIVGSVAGTMLLAVGMGFANAAVFKLVPKYSPAAVGGAAGIVGGLGAFGGFVLPPVMGMFVKFNGQAGYAQGFSVFLAMSLVAAGLIFLLIRHAPEEKKTTSSTGNKRV